MYSEPVRKWAFALAVALASLIVLVIVVGYTLPVGHRASRTVTLSATPDQVFLVITDFRDYPEWRSDVERIEVSGGPGVGQLVRESGPSGDIPYRVEVLESNRLVMRIADPDLAFGGSWTYTLEPTATGGTTLTLTEDGEVYNPIFRFMARFVLGQYTTIDAYLADLSARLDESRSAPR